MTHIATRVGALIAAVGRVALGLVTALLPSQALAESISYSFTPIIPPGPGLVRVFGLNDAGVIVGSFGSHGFLYRDGTFTVIDVPGAVATHINDINKLGQMVGTYETDEFAEGDPANVHAFFLSDGIFTTIPRVFNAWGLNDTGDIVGDYLDSHLGGLHGYLLKGGTFTPLDVPFPHASYTRAFGINNVGQVVGYYTTHPDPITDFRPLVHMGSHGFLYSGGVYQDLPVALSTHYNLQPYNIDEAGAMTGSFIPDKAKFVPDTSDGEYGFVMGEGLEGPITVLDVTEGFGTVAWGLNNRGWVVGWSGNRDHTVGFLAIPVVSAVVEPAAILLLVVGLAGVGVCKQRRRTR